MGNSISEQQILDALHQIPAERWRLVLEFLASISDADASDAEIRTAGDLAKSTLVGLWAGRKDISDSRNFARDLRSEAEHR